MSLETTMATARRLARPLKSTTRNAVASLPLKRRIAELAAVAPPLLKSTGFMHLFGSLLDHPEVRARPISTNLGLHGHRVALPADAGMLAIFGTPNEYKGERGALELVRALARECGAFVDVGAHRGYFTLIAQATAGTIPIHFVEPNPRLFQVVQSFVIGNQMANVVGSSMALGDTSGSARFYVNESSDLCSSLISPGEDERARELEVEVETFDTFAALRDIRDALVKVDVENAEEKFLVGASREMHRIRYLIIEVLGPAIGQRFVQRAQAQLGMHAYYINDHVLEHSPDGSFRYVAPQYNWLFCRLAPDALQAKLKDSPLRVATSGR